MILARSLWLFVVTDLDKISIIEVLVLPNWFYKVTNVS